MKYLLLLGTVYLAMALGTPAAQADTAQCAAKQADVAQIARLMSMINPWGTWQGTADGQYAVINLYKDAAGKFMADVDLNGKQMGPYNLTVCDYGDSFSIKLFFYEVDFEVLSSKKIKFYLPVGNSDHVIVTKTTKKKK